MAVIAPESRPLERPALEPRPGRHRRRSRLAERLTLNVVVGMIAALLAFVLAASLLKDRREMVTVAVARERIPAGAVVTASMVDFEQVPATTRFVDQLVTAARVDGGSLVATRTVQPGEPLTVSAVGVPGGVSGQRVMAIPLEAWQGANGELQVGDQVDVIEATKDGSRYVLTGAAVVGRSAGDESRGLVGGARSGQLVILVEVDGTEALDLARAIEAGTIVVVRSTGAPPISTATGAG